MCVLAISTFESPTFEMFDSILAVIVASCVAVLGQKCDVVAARQVAILATGVLDVGQAKKKIRDMQNDLLQS